MYCPDPDCPDRHGTEPPAEYREGTEQCPYCGAVLAPGTAPAATPDPPRGRSGPGEGTQNHEVTVFLAGDPTEASMVEGLLEGNGIACLRRVEGLGGKTAFFSARWAPVPGQRYEIVVSSAAEEAAHRLLEETFGPEADLPEAMPAASPLPIETRRDEGNHPSWNNRNYLLVLLVLGPMLLAGAIAIVLALLR